MRFIRTAKVREDGRISEYTFLLLICLILFGLKFINTNYLFIENNTLDLIAVQPVSPEETINHLSAHSSASLLGPSCSGLRTCAEQAQPDFDSPILAVDHIFTIRSAGVNIETKALKHNRALGVLVKGEGVLTVEHVAHGITEISVESQNGELRTPLKVASMDAGSDLLVLALRGMRDCGYEIRSHPLDQGEELRVLVQAENGHSHDLVSSIVYNVASIAAIGDVYLIALPDDRAVSGSPAFDGEGLLVGVVGGTLGSDAKYVIQVRPFTINRDQWVSLADYMGGPQSGMAKIRAMRSRGLEYISLGRLQEARVQLNSVMTLAPSFVIAKANAAAVAIRLGCIREAEKLYAEVSADMPFSPSVWWWQ